MEVKNELKLLLNEFNENKYSHVFLIETNDIIACEKELKKKIITILDADPSTELQIKQDEFIDLIFIRPDGKYIKKDQIEQLQQRLKVKPVISEKTMYVITPADALNEYASNKLLKTIEEPNENVIGFLISNSVSQILPTIKSRCENIVAFYDTSDEINLQCEEYFEYASELVKLIENKSLFDIHIYLFKNKNCSKYAKEIANLIKDYYNNACSGAIANDSYKNVVDIIKSNNRFNVIVHKAMIINKLLDNLNVNMNADLLLEKMCIDLKEVTQ